MSQKYVNQMSEEQKQPNGAEMQVAIKKYIHQFSLSDSQKQQMWQNIQRRQVRKLHKPIKRVLSAAAVFVCIVFVGGIGANAASGGKVVKSIQKLCGMEPESVEIIENMTPEAEVYAPPLLECNQRRAVFATSRGIVIYARKEKEILAVIDLQKIGCNYFTTDSVETKVIIDGNKIQIFNVKKDSFLPQGNCYSYELPKKRRKKDEILELEPSLVEKAKKALSAQWEEKMGRHYHDTFGQIPDEVQKWWDEKDGQIKYSEQSVEWEESGKKMSACLLFSETGKSKQEYKLYTWEQDTGKASEEVLEINLSKKAVKQNRQANELPRFVYTGSDEIMQVICDYIVRHETTQSDKPGSAVIPAPVIYDTVKTENGVDVFGNFWSSTYYKNGNVLEEDSGGEMPACYHLKKVKGKYKVVKVERAGDGEYYQKGIEQFCKGRPDIYQKYFDDDNQALREQVQKELIKQYVSDNQLDIRFYHEYGWDPVELYP